MSDMLQQLLGGLPAEATAFPENSRYHGIRITAIDGPDGVPVVYLRRRFVPPPERFATITFHRAREGERIDNIAAQYLGDPELAWRLADANAAMRPDELTETIGREIRITSPEYVPGGTVA
ncbi:MAG: LysM domain-containing protein [Thermoanaerobaculia bacterium]